MATETREATDHRLHVAGEWLETGAWLEVHNPYGGALVARVARGDAALVDRAVASARAALDRAEWPQWERAEALDRAAGLLAARVEDLARTIALEAGKPIKQARVEAERAVGTLRFSAVEARKLGGELVPMEAGPAGAGKLGFVLRLPIGVVGAVSPFNFPLNLVAHKLGPALAAGCPVVLKPASATPVSGIRLVELLLEAGVPADHLHVVCGSGREVGDPLVSHDDVAAISFTGSVPVGWGIRAKAPRKHVALELGSNAPLIVNDDGDWRTAADKAHVHGYTHAGQSCISIQRVLLHEAIADDFLGRFVPAVEALVVGDPLEEATDVGPVISPSEHERVLAWIAEARDGGASVLTGGEANPDGTIRPTVIERPGDDDHVWCDEVFGPVTVVRRFSSFDEGLALANGSRYGLQAGVFTRDVGRALHAARTLEFGGVCVNEVPTYRTDQMPYGGVKDSGNTREGPAYTIRELTEERLVTLQG